MIMKLEFESLNPEWYSEEQFGNYCLYVEVVDGMVVAECPKFGDRYTDVEPYPFRPTWGVKKRGRTTENGKCELRRLTE